MSNLKLIVGLGNFGREYDETYHNVGFLAIDGLLSRLAGECTKKECKSLTLHAQIDGNKLIVAKPQTYMNLSGEAVQELSHRYKILMQDVLIVCDDVDLVPGAMRFRTRGSGGTHNGLRNIVALNGEAFNRLRIGIGKAPEGRDLAGYVLSKIGGENGDNVRACIDRATDVLLGFAAGDSAELISSKANVKP